MLKSLYRYENDDKTVWAIDGRERLLIPNSAYWLSPTGVPAGPYRKRFVPVRVPKIGRVETAAELAEAARSVREWLCGDDAKRLGWMVIPGNRPTAFGPVSAREIVLPIIAELQAAALRLGRPERGDRELLDVDSATVELNQIISFVAPMLPPSGGDGKRTGRPRKEETDKNSLVIAALAKHHQYESGSSIGNYAAAGVRKLAAENSPAVTTAAVSRFLKDKFPAGGHKDYAAACRRKEIGRLLAKWQDDKSENHADLLPREYGRDDDE